MDLKALTDTELDQLRIDTITEQERRADLLAIPAQITDLATRYTAGGGNVATLREVLA